MSNFVNRLLSLLEQTIAQLGGTVPVTPAPFNRDERSVQLLDLLRQRLGTGQSIVTYSIYAPTNANYEYFFIADRPYQVTAIYYLHAVAEVTAANMNIYVDRLRASANALPGQAGFRLNDVQGFNGRAAAGVQQIPVSLTGEANLQTGDRLGIRFVSGTPTELRGIHLTLYMMPI